MVKKRRRENDRTLKPIQNGINLPLEANNGFHILEVLIKKLKKGYRDLFCKNSVIFRVYNESFENDLLILICFG